MRYPNFDLLRLSLALEVVVAHFLAVVSGYDWPGFIMAVPAFLSVSGFLVLKSFEDCNTWQEFFLRRALRILPGLILSFLICFLLFNWSDTKTAILTWATGGLILTSMRPNAPLWSLGWEELAYAALAVLWGLGAYRRPAIIALLLVISIVVARLASWLPPQTQIILFLPPAFFTGNLIYIYRNVFLKVNPLVPWIVFFLLFRWPSFPGAYVLGGVGQAVIQSASVVWAGLGGAKLIKFRFPDLSYGIYIYHLLIIYFIVDDFGTGPALSALLLALILIPLCLISWYLVEKPMIQLKKSIVFRGHRELLVREAAE